MSELIETQTSRHNLRHLLLSSAAAAALIALAYTAEPAQAADGGRPTVWIELGGQLERVNGQGAPFAPDFTQTFADSPAFLSGSPITSQRAPRYSKGLEGKITFAPEGSDWVFSASLLYGRANGNKRVHQQTAGIPLGTDSLIRMVWPSKTVLPIKAYSDVRSRVSESHAIIDFKVGKDVGVGIFGSSSVFSFGTRIAQFTSDRKTQIYARPEVHPYGGLGKYWTNFSADGKSERSFRGIGPTVSWEGETALAGNADGGVTFDWGVSAAVLFGRQKANIVHSTLASKFEQYQFNYPNKIVYHDTPPPSVRRRSVVVPNLGGFAGLSMHYTNAKISLGYRGDFFFGAMDTGIDRRKTENMSFHGPFATISIGLGG